MSAYRDYLTSLSGLQLFLPLDDAGPGVAKSGALAPYATLGVVGAPLRAQTGWADSTRPTVDKSTFFNANGGQSDYFTLSMGAQTFDWTQGYSITVMSTLRNSQNGSSMFAIKFPDVNTNALMFGWDSQYLAPGLVFGVHSLETPAGAATSAAWSYINSTAASATNLLWHVMTITVEAGGLARLYVDGVQVATGTLLRRPQNNSKEFFVAKRHDQAGYNGSSFQGKLINLGIFNRVLTPAEITEAQNRSDQFYGLSYAVRDAGADTMPKPIWYASDLNGESLASWYTWRDIKFTVEKRRVANVYKTFAQHPTYWPLIPIANRSYLMSPGMNFVVGGGGGGPSTSRPAYGQLWPRGRGR